MGASAADGQIFAHC